uniref:Uncharacterized protein n=1 Tax=Oryza barthii TaxID=65489 RepID=A0A0D3GUQ1_9ORYZ
MAALRYELPAQGLLYKRPMIVRGEDMDFSRFGDTVMYDLIYASAVFLHIPDKLVWTGLERLAGKLRPQRGRIFVSHNIKFCSRLGGDECTRRLTELGLEYVGKHTHDSLLFNHYEIWWQHHTPELVQDKTAEEEEEEEAEAEGWPSPSEAEEIAVAGAGDPLERVLLLYLVGSV